MPTRRVFYWLFGASFVVWNVYEISRAPSEERVFLYSLAAIFVLLYILPAAIFGAKIEPAQDGLRVTQYGQTLIRYSEIRHCYSVFILPVQALIVITTREFPLNILVSGDRLSEPRRSLRQDGELAKAIKSRLGRT
jgi:hypothetical protein